MKTHLETTESVSIWQSERRGQRLEKSQEELSVDVVIVGAGITGLTAAKYLAAAGKSIVILDAGPIGSGTTGLSSAHLSTLCDYSYSDTIERYGLETAKTLARSMEEGIEIIESTVSEIKIDCEFQRVDGYYFSEGPDESKIMREFAASERVSINPEWVRKLALPFEFNHAFRIGRQAQFHPVKYLAKLAEDLQSRGNVKILEHAHVRDWRETEAGIRVTHTGGNVFAKHAIFATHTPLGGGIVHSSLAPYRSYILAASLKNIVPMLHGLYWDDADPYHYIRSVKWNDETYLIIGGEDRKTGHGNEKDSMQALENYARSHFPIEEIRFRWSAQFYDSSCALPVVGMKPFSKHTSFASGFSGDGLVFGSLAGKILASQLQGEKTIYDQLFSPSQLHPQGLLRFVKENWDVAKSFVKDRLSFSQKSPPIEELEVGEGAVFKTKDGSIAAYRDEKELRVFDAVCPHMKCIVHWNALRKSFDCPCHGSRFSCEGKVLEGPALSDLVRKTTGVQQPPITDSI